MNIKESIILQSDIVQTKKNRRDRKNKGVFYTPPEIVEGMTEKVLSRVDLAVNPYIKILDPACGTGLFLIKAFEVLERNFRKNYDSILERNRELIKRVKPDEIGSFIVNNNLWGGDIDMEALNTAGNMLIQMAGKGCIPNLILGDSLINGNLDQKSPFDYVLGNPPYIGHKHVPKEYKELLQKLYNNVYKDKSDISYCFIKKGIDLLKEGGCLSFITSRYFMEGPSAEGLRRYITDNCTITEVIDFYGQSVFQDAKIAACIITLIKGDYEKEAHVMKYRQEIKLHEIELFSPLNFECFTLKQKEFGDNGWVLLSPEKHEIFSIAEEKEGLRLSDITESYQGIITGCDRAFIVSRAEVNENKIEEDLLKPWIKNSNISKNDIKAADKYLIYSDIIKNEKDFPNAIKHISNYRDRLMNRRECKRGVRKWYQLQWGRKSGIFEAPKIVYPFKSSSSRFAVDESGYYCSADVYSLNIKREYEGRITLEYITAILNSRFFEFYFKCYAKKVSGNIFDYYPNTVLKMKIPILGAVSPVYWLAYELKNCKDKDCRKNLAYAIDREVYKMYGLNDRQVEIIEK